MNEKKSSVRLWWLAIPGGVMMLALVIGALISTIFLNPRNLGNIFVQCGPTLLIGAAIAIPFSRGHVDLSVLGVACFTGMVSTMIANAAYLHPAAMILIAICFGAAIGAINGLILTKFTELAPMIVTLATNIIFRGLSERILGDGSTGGMQNVAWFSELYYGRIGNIVPYLFLFFCVLALVFGLVMHKTVFGRQMFAIGENKKAAAYAGIKVQNVRMIVFTLAGLICGIIAIFYCSWMGSVKSNACEGYELEAISMCVLGGISTSGGKGTFVGAFIAIFIVGLLRYGLNLINLSGQTIRIILGALLIVVVLYPTIQEAIRNRKKAVK